MDLEFVPLLRVQRQLYDQPRGMERFRSYLHTMVDARPGDLALPLPQNFSLDFMKPLRYGGRHGDSESGLTYSTGQPRPVARRAGRGGVAGRRQPRAGGRPRL